MDYTCPGCGAELAYVDCDACEGSGFNEDLTDICELCNGSCIDENILECLDCGSIYEDLMQGGRGNE